MQETFQKVDVGIARQSLESLHDHVVQKNKRIIITKSGSDESAVLISLAELNGIERALEILSNTNGALQMRDQVMRIISRANEIPATVISPMG